MLIEGIDRCKDIASGITVVDKNVLGIDGCKSMFTKGVDGCRDVFSRMIVIDDEIWRKYGLRRCGHLLANEG